jgi:hypothetical protein
MQQSNAPSKLPLAFAASGGKNTIPTASNPTPGGASLADGFPPLTRTDPTAGGKPPSGLDMNGILNAISAITRWSNAGGGYAYDSSFATDSNVLGYPKGATVLSSDGLGAWKNLTDNNQVDPEGANTGWIPAAQWGNQAISVSGSNITLTYLQANKYSITLSGTLTSNINLVFPAWAGVEWLVVANFTGAFAVTCKTASGAGVAVSASTNTTIYCDGTNIINANLANATVVAPIQSLTASVASNALTASLSATTLQFRSGTLSSGTVSQVAVPALSITVPSGATLGSVNAQQCNLALLVAYNGGSPVLCITNIAGGVDLSETGVISPTAISAGSTSASVIYSASSVSANSPYRVVGYLAATEATAGAWATAPSLLQGQGGQALASLSSLGYGQTWQAVTRTLNTTYYNTTGKPILINVTYNYVSGSTFINVLGQASVRGGGSGGVLSISSCIPPGASYTITVDASNTIANVYELR